MRTGFLAVCNPGPIDGAVLHPADVPGANVPLVLVDGLAFSQKVLEFSRCLALPHLVGVRVHFGQLCEL